MEALELVKDGLLNRPSLLQMLDHNSLEQLRGDVPVPYTFRIDHNDGTSRTDPEAWSLSALYASRPEEEAFALEQRSQK